jgi:gamma-tubulin complex component 2
VLTHTSDQPTKDLLLFLLDKAAVPFFSMLEQWIYRGAIQDTYGEFFVEEHEAFKKEALNEDYNDAYWEQRYTLKQDQLPLFLTRLADKILVTGKYLNVIRECGLDINAGHEPFQYSTNDREYADKIERAYIFASKRLLEVLINDKKFIDRLRYCSRMCLLV